MVSNRKCTIGACLLILAACSAATAGTNGVGDISFSLEPPVFGDGDPVLLTINVQQTEAPVQAMTLLRGVTADFTLTTLEGMPTEVNFLEPMDGALYAAFPVIGDPPGVVATVYVGLDPNPPFMYDLTDGSVVPLLDLTVIAGDGIVDWSGMDLTFGFGVEPDDPISHWTFENGGLIGDQNTPVPEPATLALLAMGAVAALRRKRAAP